jgi:hypothetical protein
VTAKTKTKNKFQTLLYFAAEQFQILAGKIPQVSPQNFTTAHLRRKASRFCASIKHFCEPELN